MCGISLTLVCSSAAPASSTGGTSVDSSIAQWASLAEQTLRRRGPDSQRSISRQWTRQPDEAKADGARGGEADPVTTTTAILTATVLHLRGASSEVTVQPLVDSSTGNVLCWNGEVYSVDRAALTRAGPFPCEVPPLHPDQNDTAYVLALLCALPVSRFAESLTRLMSAIDGPFCFVFLHEPTRTLWYGRDKLGRRSLVATRRPLSDGVEVLHISSLILRRDEQDQQAWGEVATTGLWCFDLSAPTEAPAGAAAAASLPSITLRHSPYPHIAPHLGAAAISDLPIAVSLACGVESTSPPYARKPEDLSAAARIEAAAAAILPHIPPAVAELPPACQLLYSALHTSMAKRIGLLCTPASPSHARVGILFSGGIDCMVLALLAHKLLPAGEPIDLINVAFCGELRPAAVNRLVPDRVTSINGWRELRRCSQEDARAASPGSSASRARRWNLLHVNVTLRMLEQNRAHIVSLLEPNSTVMDFNIASVLWFGTMVRGRLYEETVGEEAAHGPADQAEFVQSRLSRLGVEHARPADESPALEAQAEDGTQGDKKKREKGRTVPPEILAQLLAAKQARMAEAAAAATDPSTATSIAAAPSPSASPDSDSDVEATPAGASSSRDTKSDRRAQKALERKLIRAYFKKQDRKAHDEELEDILPTKDDFELPDNDAQNDIAYEVDEPTNPAAAAAAATPAACDSSSSVPSGSPVLYTSHAKVLLIGIGADEQLAGYGRHRTVWARSGAVGLAAELAKDFDRIWRRNLGRDDRIVSDSGREARHPFLDEQLVELIHSLPLDQVCDFSKPPGVGDKRILRLVARALGLATSSLLVKRAMQFGSRIANKKVAGYVPMDSSIVLREIVNPFFLRAQTTAATAAASSSSAHRSSAATPAYDTSAPRHQLNKRVQKAHGKPGFE